MSVAVYNKLTAVYNQQRELLDQPQPDVAELQALMVQAEELLGQIEEPSPDQELAAAATRALEAQRAASVGMYRHREILRRAAAGVHRGADALRAYGSPATKQNARFIDQRH